jgi:putative FmdB family regulatory protein
MPIYVYRCKNCGEKFEDFRSIHDSDDEVACPSCGEKSPQRVVSSVFSRGSSGNRGNLTFPT